MQEFLKEVVRLAMQPIREKIEELSGGKFFSKSKEVENALDVTQETPIEPYKRRNRQGESSHGRVLFLFSCLTPVSPENLRHRFKINNWF